jgi:hypothetical protein
MTKIDPALEAIRKVRHEISREFENDPARLVEHYLALQRRMPRTTKLVQGPADDSDVKAPDRDAAQLGR